MPEMVKRWRKPAVAIAASAGLIVGAIGIGAGGASALPPGSGDNHYQVTNVSSDQMGVAPIHDKNLVNAWGLAFGPSTPLWVSNNGSSTSTLYSGGVGMTPFSMAPLVVNIAADAPTGVVYNPTSGFPVTAGGVTKPAAFIFATESGSIVGWNMDVPPGMSPSTQSEVVKTIPNAVYKGIAMGVMNGKSFLYATNFHQGTVDVFDDNFMPVSMPMNAFKDPALPHGYAPFDIANIGGKFYVTYARQDADAHDDAAAPHRGYIDVYDMFGNLQRRFATRGPLNSPWGLALAPAGFGRFAGALIVGNFGDGHAMAYSPGSGRFLGYLRDATGTALHIDGLWGLLFGNGVAGSTKTLIFSAGPDHEMHGLLGTITGG